MSDRLLEVVDLKKYFEKYHTMQMEHFKVNENEIADTGHGRVIVQEAKGRREKSE